MTRPSRDLEAATLLEIFDEHARHRADEMAFVFLGPDGAETRSLTFGELHREASAIADGLRARGNMPGDRVLLLTPPGPNFLSNFLGTLQAGMVAVPAMAPRAREGAQHLARILNDAGISAVLAAEATLERIQRLDPELFGCLDDRCRAFRMREKRRMSQQSRCDSHHPAFLQYTSGSTGEPKGVVVTHANLIDNQRLIARAFGHDRHSTVVVGWLPLHHDMGLVGNVMQPIFLGRPCILLNPMDFLVRPLRWLQAIEKYRATTSGGPDFAYTLCTQKISAAEAASLDLSSWKLAFNGAEPVRASTMAGFARHFSASGFDMRAFYPCYGMAECTLFVAGPVRAQETQCVSDNVSDTVEKPLDHAMKTLNVAMHGARSYVSVGFTWGDNIVRIVDPVSGKPCEAGETGEIWVSGPSVSPGYWGQEALTKAAFDCRLAEEPGRGFFRTGDLGFQDSSARLYIVGRMKDMIIVRGVNYYAEDIEAALALHPLLKGARLAAFSIDGDSGEELVILAEASRKQAADEHTREGLRAFRAIVIENFGIRPAVIAWTAAGALPVTTSGKVRRKQCRADFLAQLIPLLWATGETEQEGGNNI